MPTDVTGRKYTFIDLFAGAGGLSEGFIQAGFEPVAHVEMDRYAANTLETRAGYYYLQSNDQLNVYRDYLRGRISREAFVSIIPEDILKGIFCETMSKKTLPRLYDEIDRILDKRGIGQVDVIIGGPPCQAYSIVGRAQNKRMNTPMEEDPRSELYKLYCAFLKKYQPQMFVFENVMGIESAKGGQTWKNIQKYLKRVGYQIECHEQNARDFGVLQNRKRMVIVGWLKDSGRKYPEFEKKSFDAVVNDLLSDLPAIAPGKSGTQYVSEYMSEYLRMTKIRAPEDVLTLHVSRPNTQQDIAIYRIAIKLWNDDHQRLKYDDLPDNLKTHKNRTSFTDRFKVVEGNNPYCHTMLAHIAKDGHYFIHPDIRQHRSLTPREAARIQSFPDSYFFEGPRTAQYVQIGNAVPPMMAKGIAEGIAKELAGKDSNGKQSPS